MYWKNRREQFRAQLEIQQCIHPASVFDPLSARIAEDIGYEVAMFAGSVASLTILGDPDHILITLSEFADQALRINRASNIPLIVDADHGYGNALNVKRTVEELEIAGISALSIEDTELPTPFGAEGACLISIEEGVGKMRAALAGRQDKSLVIFARTSAPGINGIDDAIKRVKAYQNTGVDGIFLLGIKQKEELEAIAEICSLPIILGGASSKIMNQEAFAALGVRISLQGHQPIMASIQAVYNTMKALRSNKSASGLPAKETVDKFSRVEEFDQWIKDFL